MHKILSEKQRQGLRNAVKKYYSKEVNKRRRNFNRSRNIQNTRKTVLDVMGGKCVLCNFSDYRALQIDHILGDGHTERGAQLQQVKYLKNVARSFTSNQGRYQLLCANCNWIKRHRNKEYTIKNKTLV